MPPLPAGAGEPFVQPREDDSEIEVSGRIALVVLPDTTEHTLLVVEVDPLPGAADGDDGWTVATQLSSGQLHRLTNALAGRGTRSGIRPLLLGTDEHVYLTGSPELLVVETGDRVVRVPAGPKRALSKALRAFESSAEATTAE